MPTGLEDFGELIRGYKGVLAATLGGALLALISEFSGIVPPFPEGVVQITAIFQLLILIVVFQIIDKRSKKFVDRHIIISLIIFVFILLTYLLILNIFTYSDPDGEIKLKGLICTDRAQLYFEGACLFISDAQVTASGGIEGDIWTDLGRDLAGMIVLVLWLVMFSSVSYAVAVFANFQRKRSVI